MTDKGVWVDPRTVRCEDCGMMKSVCMCNEENPKEIERCSFCQEKIRKDEPRYLVMHAEERTYLECYDVVVRCHEKCLPIAALSATIKEERK